MSNIKRYTIMIHTMTDYDGVPIADAEPHAVVLASDYDRLEAQLREARELLLGAQTHLLDGDNSRWRRQLDAFLAATEPSDE